MMILLRDDRLFAAFVVGVTVGGVVMAGMTWAVG